MIRFSIYFLSIFFLTTQSKGWSQNYIPFNCYNLDSISWELSIPTCPTPEVDSFHVLTRSNENSGFTVHFTGTDEFTRGYQHEDLKTVHDLMIKYYLRCPDVQIILSDTISLSALRESVLLDTIRVLSNGDVELAWRKKPIEGVRYTINAAVQGSSKVLATNIKGNRYTDTRGLATRDIEYYSISAALDCGYTFPEPDSFYHTPLLSYKTVPCNGEITFDYVPFSYWNNGTAAAELLVQRNGQFVDTVTLSVGQTSFTYNRLVNQESYTFYVKEYGADQKRQVAFSNPVSINTDFYQPVRWIVIDELTIDPQNQGIISWTINDHQPVMQFEIDRNGTPQNIPETDLTMNPATNRYTYLIPDFTLNNEEYSIMLQDSCGNMVQSLLKQPLLTQGQLNGGIDLTINWSDVSDTEWTVNTYEIYYQTNGSYSFLGSVDGSTLDYQHTFDENNPFDSLCYYIVAKGEVSFTDKDSTASLSIRSNTVCLYGKTVVQLPNAYRSGHDVYKPVIAPRSNLTAYTLRIYDRYGSLVFETNNPEEGWNGQHQGREGFMNVYVVKVEITNGQGEKIQKSGSLLLFP